MDYSAVVKRNYLHDTTRIVCKGIILGKKLQLIHLM